MLLQLYIIVLDILLSQCVSGALLFLSVYYRYEMLSSIRFIITVIVDSDS